MSDLYISFFFFIAFPGYLHLPKRVEEVVADDSNAHSRDWLHSRDSHWDHGDSIMGT